MSDPAGLALAAVFVLLFAYLIPQLVKQRRIADESQMHERYSARPRVVASPARTPAAPVVHSGTSGSILTQPAWDTEGRSVVIRPPVNARHAKVTLDLPQPIKLSRAEAARRRAIVAAALAGLTVAGFALMMTSMLPAWAGWALFLAPAIGLGVSLAMGRRAVLANRRSDEEYLARLRRRQEERIHPHAVSRPVADLAGDDADAGAARKARKAAVKASAPARPAVPPAKADPGPRIEVTEERVGEGRVDGEREAREEREERDGGEEDAWTPVEVPKPSYVTKPKAPRWVPEPLAINDLSGADAGMSHTVLSTGSGPDGEDGPVVRYTELDLDAILERRRVV